MAIVKRKLKTKVVYQVKLRDENGDFFPAPLFDFKSDADAYHAEILNKKNQGTTSQKIVSRKTLLKDYWNEWKKECCVKCSPCWSHILNQRFRDYIEPILGNTEIGKIQDREVNKVLLNMEAKKLAKQTQKHVFGLLYKMLNDAVTYFKYLPENPLTDSQKPEVPQKERKYLTPEESWKLLIHVKDHKYGTGIWIMLLAGLRAEALIGLKWGAIDFDQGFLTIQNCFKRFDRAFSDLPKGKKQAVVTIPKILLEYLSERKGNPNEFVIKGDKQDRLCPDTFNRKLKIICLEAGIKSVTAHELRHSTSSIWIDAGANEMDMMRLLTHSDSNVTKRYIHIADERLKRIGEKIEAREDSLVKTSNGCSQIVPT